MCLGLAQGYINKLENLTKSEMINKAMEEPYQKYTHPLFADDEYIYTKGGNLFYNENGDVFEDWDYFSNHHNGLRIRKAPEWQTGWHKYKL